MNPDTNNEVARLRAEVQRAIEDRNRIGVKIRGEYLPKLKETTNEVARLRERMQEAETLIKRGHYGWKKAEAEVARLREENQKLRELCERAIDDAVDALEERDLKRRIADEIESRRKEMAALTNSTN